VAETPQHSRIQKEGLVKKWILLGLAMLLLTLVIDAAQKSARDNYCMNHGYAESVVLRNKVYCIDYRLGQPSKIGARDDMDDPMFPPHIVIGED